MIMPLVLCISSNLISIFRDNLFSLLKGRKNGFNIRHSTKCSLDYYVLDDYIP